MTATAAKPARRPPKPGTPEHALLLALAAERAAPDLFAAAEAARAVEAARLALVLGWRRLQWKTARRWWNGNGRRGPVGDYFAWVRVGWWEAALKFDPGLGFKFQTYAHWYALKYLGPHAHREAAGGLHVPQTHGLTHVPVRAFGAMGDGGGDDQSAAEHLVPDRHGPAELPPDSDGFWAAVFAALPNRRWRQVVWVRYGLGASQDETAKTLRVTRSRVQKIEAAALDRLRTHGAGLMAFTEAG